MATAHTVRIGTRRAKSRAKDLYSIPWREASDDGTVVVGVGSDGAYDAPGPTCSDCGRGILRWAEAGFVPWHRICDTCGSHWELTALRIYAASPQILQEMAMMAAQGCAVCAEWCETCDYEGRSHCAQHRGHTHALTCQYVRRQNGVGWVAIDPSAIMGESETPWSVLLAEIPSDTYGPGDEIPAAWARRARFY